MNKVAASPSETTVMRVKDLMSITNTGRRYSKALLENIKEQYSVDIVTYQHVKKYLHIT
ncbi:MAG: hypothetical protein FWE63_02025 [Bacteroidales bacterium]|nr:hypothetical protein [Bacteroidales bacterium]